MKKQVLLCDDEIHIIRAAEFKICRAGYEVRCAHDGEAGWAEILRLKPDVLVTDFQMPILDGFGLCRRIRQHPEYRDIPIFMLTAKGFELTQAEVIRELGVLEVIAKPFSPRELLQRIESVLGPATSDQAPQLATAQ